MTPSVSSAKHFPGIPATYKGYALRWCWQYLDRDGVTVLGIVARYAKPDGGKDVIPFFQPDGRGGWKSGQANDSRRPLYGLHTLTRGGDVYVVEGERCAAALHSLGLAAVTSCGGCEAAAKADWTPLSGVSRVVILPDHDTPGDHYADAVAGILAALPNPPECCRVDLPNLADKGDVVDWLQARVWGWDGFDLVPLQHGDGLLDEFLEVVQDYSQIVPLATAQPCDNVAATDSPVPLLPEDSPEPFPVDALGEVLGSAARVIHETVQAPLAMCCNSVLAAAALATQPHGDVYITGIGKRPISEFFLTVGESGERKSTVDRWALAAVNDYGAELRRNHLKARQEYVMAMDTYKFVRRQTLAAHKKANKDAVATALREIGPAPAPPATPVLIVSDLTLEGLRDVLDKGCAAVGVFTDEGGTMTGGHAMLPENQLKTLAGLSELWDGKELIIVRKLDGVCVLAGRRVSMHLMMQPAVAAQLLDNPMANGQGFLSRCLCVWPNSTAGSRVFLDKDLNNDARLIPYNERLRDLLQTQPQMRDGAPGELDPNTLTIGSEAHELLVAFYREVEEQVGPDGEYRDIKALANKGMEHAARLAGILTVFEGVDTSVSADTMRRGCDLARFYLQEALRIKGVGRDFAERDQADRLLRSLQRSEDETFSVRDICRNGPGDLRKAALALPPLRLLEEYGHVVKVQDRPIRWRLVRADGA
jgi:hypothetical protein